MNKNKKQIVVYPEREMICPCEQCYLAEGYLDMGPVRSLIKGRYTVLPYPFKTDKDYISANQYIVNLTGRMIHAYGHALNQDKGIDFSDRQWTVILCIWLKNFLFRLYYKYSKLLAVRDEDVFLSGTDFSMEDESAASDISSVLNEARIWTYVADAMGIECEINAVTGREKEKREGIYREKLLAAVRHPARGFQILRRRMARLEKEKNISENVQTLLVRTLFPDGWEERMSKASGGTIGYLDAVLLEKESNEILKKYRKNSRWRKEVFQNAFAAQSEFEKIAHRAVTDFLPRAYAEALGEMYTKAAEITKKWNVRRYYSSYMCIELLDYCIAFMIPKGIEINLMQHSAAYARRITQAAGECMYADNFLTWGWEGLDYEWLRAKVKPVAVVRQPAQALSGRKRSCKKILYATNIGELSDFGQGVVPGDYVRNSLRFIGALDIELRRRLCIRCDPCDDLNRELVRRCRKKYPEIRFESRYEKNFTDSMLESEFLISDYYGSTHIEALCLGKPFVMFDALRFSVHSEYFEEHAKPLRENGIYPKDGMELAKMLNQRKQDMSWLREECIKNIYDEYLYAFTRMGDDIRKIWKKEIRTNAE